MMPKTNSQANSPDAGSRSRPTTSPGPRQSHDLAKPRQPSHLVQRHFVPFVQGRRRMEIDRQFWPRRLAHRRQGRGPGQHLDPQPKPASGQQCRWGSAGSTLNLETAAFLPAQPQSNQEKSALLFGPSTTKVDNHPWKNVNRIAVIIEKDICIIIESRLAAA